MSNPKHRRNRRRLNVEHAHRLSQKTGLTEETARKWLQFCGFRLHAAVWEWDTLLVLLDHNEVLLRTVIGTLFTGKAFCPGKFDDQPREP